jgi:gliding motility-associated lipoprotein GldD
MKKLRLNYAIQILVVFLLISCNQRIDSPKPIGNIRLSFPENKYKLFVDSDFPYSFENSIHSTTELREEKGWVNLNYPKMKATIYLTYYSVKNNLFQLIKDTEKLTFDSHAIKANEIKGQPYENTQNKVYGTLFRLSGNTATNLQFYLTDSTKHFVSGSVYFRVRPNYDSILPAIDYLEKDVKKLMETVQWK